MKCKNTISLFCLLTTKTVSPEKCCWKSACLDAATPPTTLLRSAVQAQPSFSGPLALSGLLRNPCLHLAGNGEGSGVLPQRQAQP